jgi:hypothetical protein
MPAVDTIEALIAAVHAFGAQPLGALQMDPDAEAAVRESLQRSGLVLLGEIHGVAQTPVLLGEMIARFGLGGIALEWHHDLRPWLDRWVAHGVLSDPRGGSALAGEVWGGDGRLTAGHLVALRRWADSGLLITLMDGTTVTCPRRGESAEQLERRSWTERDVAMAGRVLAAPDAVGGRLVVAGNLHTKLEPLPVGVPMGVHLARQRPGLCSIDFVYGPGRFYNLGPRPLGDRLPGAHLDAPCLIQQQGALCYWCRRLERRPFLIASHGPYSEGDAIRPRPTTATGHPERQDFVPHAPPSRGHTCDDQWTARSVA